MNVIINLNSLNLKNQYITYHSLKKKWRLCKHISIKSIASKKTQQNSMFKLITQKVKANTIVNKYTDFLASVGKEGKKSIMGGDSLFSRLEMWKIVVTVWIINYPSAISFTLDFPDSRCGKQSEFGLKKILKSLLL